MIKRVGQFISDLALSAFGARSRSIAKEYSERRTPTGEECDIALDEMIAEEEDPEFKDIMIRMKDRSVEAEKAISFLFDTPMPFFSNEAVSERYDRESESVLKYGAGIAANIEGLSSPEEERLNRLRLENRICQLSIYMIALNFHNFCIDERYHMLINPLADLMTALRGHQKVVGEHHEASHGDSGLTALSVARRKLTAAFADFKSEVDLFHETLPEAVQST